MRHEEELQKAVAFEQEKLNKLKSKRDKEEAETAFQQALAIEMQSASWPGAPKIRIRHWHHGTCSTPVARPRTIALCHVMVRAIRIHICGMIWNAKRIVQYVVCSESRSFSRKIPAQNHRGVQLTKSPQLGKLTQPMQR